jgi:hypothetical protein
MKAIRVSGACYVEFTARDEPGFHERVKQGVRSYKLAAALLPISPRITRHGKMARPYQVLACLLRLLRLYLPRSINICNTHLTIFVHSFGVNSVNPALMNKRFHQCVFNLRTVKCPLTWYKKIRKTTSSLECVISDCARLQGRRQRDLTGSKPDGVGRAS